MLSPPFSSFYTNHSDVRSHDIKTRRPQERHDYKEWIAKAIWAYSDGGATTPSATDQTNYMKWQPLRTVYIYLPVAELIPAWDEQHPLILDHDESIPRQVLHSDGTMNNTTTRPGGKIYTASQASSLINASNLPCAKIPERYSIAGRCYK